MKRGSRVGVLTCAVSVFFSCSVATTHATPATPTQVAAVTSHDTLLERPAHGEKAISELGAEITEAAARNDASVPELKDLLRTDRTAWVDTRGQVFYIDPFPEPAPTRVAEAAPHPYAQTFSLHSNPTSTRKIFLDFDGHPVTGTAWNDSFGLSTSSQPAFDLDGSAGSFSEPERDVVQSVWQRVSEDFAPFDVDVTTADPGPAGLQRTNLDDAAYGVRALVTPSTSAVNAVCGGGCGGIAYVGVFDAPDTELPSTGYYAPAWVFPQKLGNDAKNIAEAVSHEVGHTLGLDHDGTATQGYYAGHGSWAPIMGVGYDRPISQWSAGEYAGASNLQDDLAVIRSHDLAVRSDDHGDTIATATPLGAGTTLTTTGIIARRADTDYLSIVRSCAGSLTVTANPAPTSPNLDVGLRVLTAGGAQLAAANPPSQTEARDLVSGLSASLTVDVPAGTFLLEVDGVGAPPLTTGYSDYGSLGAYTVTANGCGEGTPDAPASVSVSKDDTARTGTISWQPPASTGSSPITGYLVKRDGFDANGDGPQAVTLPATARTHTFGSLLGGTTALSVQSVNAAGSSAPSIGQVTLAAMAPGTPQSSDATKNIAAESATLTWTTPLHDGGSAITGYTLTRSGANPVQLPFTARSHTFDGLTAGATYTLTVAAENIAGTGPAASRELTMVATTPGAPTQVSAEAFYDGGYAVLSWQPPGSTGDSAITGYVVDRDGPDVWDEFPATLGEDQSEYYFFDLEEGRPYQLSVYAVNGSGPGTAVSRSVVLEPPTGASAPLNLEATAGDRQATLTWSPPDDPGTYPIDEYEVTLYRGAAVQSTDRVPASADSTFTKTGLTNAQTYTFEVRALTWYGLGESARSAVVTPKGPPGAPGIGTAKPGAAGGKVTAKALWAAPTSTGGSPTTGYTVTALRMSAAGAVLSETVSGLRPASSVSFSMVLPRKGNYRFRVQAVNAVGTSIASARSNKVAGR